MSPAPCWCQNLNVHLSTSGICLFALPHYTFLLGWPPQSIWVYLDTLWNGSQVFLRVRQTPFPFLGRGHSQCWEGGEVFGEKRQGAGFLSLRVGSSGSGVGTESISLQAGPGGWPWAVMVVATEQVSGQG